VDRPEDCRALVQRTIAEFGSIYSVFANAGYGLERPIHLTSDAELRAIFETNFFGTMNTIRPALEVMSPGRSGHILICSSCLAKLGIPLVGAYSATKAAQDHIGRAMRAELRDQGILVSTVHPVGTATEFFERKASETGRPVMTSPPKFFLQKPEKVARAIVRRLRKGRGGEVWTSPSAILSFAFLMAFPGLTDRLLVSYMRKQQSQSKPSP
jgi:short-subunit dehydrogenase